MSLLRETRRTMESHGICPDDDVLNVVGVKQREQIFEVLLSFQRIVS